LSATAQPGATCSRTWFRPATVFNATGRASRLQPAVHPPGNKFSVTRSHKGELQLASYRIDPEHLLLVSRDGESFHAEIKETPGKITTVAVSGSVEGSLFDSVIAAGEKPELAVRHCRNFRHRTWTSTRTAAWNIFHMLVEKTISDGSAPIWTNPSG
jgi:hypothetical protein